MVPHKDSRLTPRAADARPVSAALLAADRAMKRGDTPDVLRWVRRAAEAASEAEDDVRALELAKCAAELAMEIRESTLPPPMAVPVMQLPRAKAPSAPDGKKGAPARGGDTRAVRAIVAEIQAPERTRSPSKTDAKEAQADAKKKAQGRADKPAKRPSRTDEIDDWKTESLSNADLSALIAAEGGTVRASQAVRVVVWREDDGVRVVPQGAVAPAHAIMAVLTALEPEADLLTLFPLAVKRES
jgi:hypothetical protein